MAWIAVLALVSAPTTALRNSRTSSAEVGTGETNAYPYSPGG